MSVVRMHHTRASTTPRAQAKRHDWVATVAMLVGTVIPAGIAGLARTRVVRWMIHRVQLR